MSANAITDDATVRALCAMPLPTYHENDRCEFCGLNPWTVISTEVDGCFRICAICNATCQECGEVGGHLTSCSEFQREPEAADRPLRDWDREAEDARI